MKFEIYADVNIFETIILEGEKYPNWNNIMKFYSDVFLNINQNDFDKELKDPDNSVIVQYFLNNGGKALHVAEEYFQNFSQNNSIVESKPFSTYFLDKKDTEIRQLTDRFGLLFQNGQIDDTVVSSKFYKDLKKNQIVEKGGNKGWEALVGKSNYVFNTLVLSDPYLFHNTQKIGDKEVNIGVQNLKEFLGSILPLTLGVDFHLLIVAEEKQPGFANNKVQNIYNEINDHLKNVRNYTIIFELILMPETIHKRRAFTNYFTFKCDKGFKVFSPRDMRKVLENNDVRVEGIFNVCKSEEGDPQFQELLNNLPDIKREVANVISFVNVSGNTSGRKCFGLLSSGGGITNRIINSFP